MFPDQGERLGRLGLDSGVGFTGIRRRRDSEEATTRHELRLTLCTAGSRLSPADTVLSADMPGCLKDAERPVMRAPEAVTG